MKKCSALLIALFLLLAPCSTQSENARQFDVDIRQVTVFFKPDFQGEIWIKELRFSKERDKLAVRVNHKEQDDILHKFAVMDIDGRDEQEISAESFAKFDKPFTHELPESVEARMKGFLEKNFESHKGILGGTVTYEVVSWMYSPDKRQTAFMIQGYDGHAIFNPSLYVADKNGRNVTKIDSGSGEMCRDIIWLSDSEIAYAKNMKVWKAVIR